MTTVHGSLAAKEANTSSSALLNTYSRYNVEFAKGEGAYLFDAYGREYLDFLCGIAVTSFGHNNSDIKQAVLNQVNNYWHVSNLFESTLQLELANKLAVKSGLDFVFFSNSGTEANEAAIKFARKWGNGRKQIISTLNSFHGRSYASLSASGQYKLWDGFQPLVPGFSHVEYGNISAIEQAYTPDTVAVIVETIQGEGGVILPPDNYLIKLRRFCTSKNILLIIDEVQTGIGRTGKFFSYQHKDILPDIVTSAKGLANGLPLGATLCSKKVAKAIKPGSHGSTFGGNPVAVAAANKVVDLIDDYLLNTITNTGSLILNSLHGLNSPVIKDIRGLGLMIGVEFNGDISAKNIASKMLGAGVLVGTSGESVIRLLPPFIITQKEIMKFLLTFRNVLEEY